MRKPKKKTRKKQEFQDHLQVIWELIRYITQTLSSSAKGNIPTASSPTKAVLTNPRSSRYSCYSRHQDTSWWSLQSCPRSPCFPFARWILSTSAGSACVRVGRTGGSLPPIRGLDDAASFSSFRTASHSSQVTRACQMHLWMNLVLLPHWLRVTIGSEAPEVWIRPEG